MVTHAHSDHIAGAPAIRERWPSTRLSKMPWPIRDRDLAWTPLADGDLIETGEGTLQVVHTPGHAPDHICLWHAESRTLFVGDMLVQGTTVVIPASHGGSVAEYLASLDRLLRLNPARALPAHGPVIEDPAALIHYYIKHRAEREEQVLAALHAGAVTVDDLLARIYPELQRGPRGVCARERACAFDQTRKREPRAARDERFRAGGRGILSASMVRKVGLAGAAFLFLYAVASVATGQQLTALGDLAQLIPPLVYAGFTIWLARQSRGQVRVFWNLNAMHGVIWAIGQVVWTYYDLFRGGVPAISPTDPLFFVSSIPLAAALYGRPERDRPRWLFDIVLLDLVLIALFSAFVYIYFVVSIAVTDGREDLYKDNLTQLLNARNLLLALWATYVWRTSSSPPWRRMLGVYATRPGADVRLAAWFTAPSRRAGTYAPGALWDIVFMAPYVAMLLAAASRLRREALRARGRSAGAVEAAGRIADRHRAAGGDPGDRSHRAAVPRGVGGHRVAAHPARARDDDPVRPGGGGARVPVAARPDPGGTGPGVAHASSSCRRRSWRRSGSWCRAWRTN